MDTTPYTPPGPPAPAEIRNIGIQLARNAARNMAEGMAVATHWQLVVGDGLVDIPLGKCNGLDDRCRVLAQWVSRLSPSAVLCTFDGLGVYPTTPNAWKALTAWLTAGNALPDHPDAQKAAVTCIWSPDYIVQVAVPFVDGAPMSIERVISSAPGHQFCQILQLAPATPQLGGVGWGPGNVVGIDET